MRNVIKSNERLGSITFLGVSIHEPILNGRLPAELKLKAVT